LCNRLGVHGFFESVYSLTVTTSSVLLNDGTPQAAMTAPGGSFFSYNVNSRNGQRIFNIRVRFQIKLNIVWWLYVIADFLIFAHVIDFGGWFVINL
jgi:hypothetical protein